MVVGGIGVVTVISVWAKAAGASIVGVAVDLFARVGGVAVGEDVGVGGDDEVGGKDGSGLDSLCTLTSSKISGAPS